MGPWLLLKFSYIGRCDQRHDEVGDSSGLLVSGIFSADKISVIDKVTTIAHKEGLKTPVLGHFLAPFTSLLYGSCWKALTSFNLTCL